MPLQVSKALTKRLPAEEQPGLEDFLRAKANGLCYLCAAPMNEASEIIVVDHDVPEQEGGKTERANLHLAHRTCNAAKRNAPTIDVRPLLKLQAFLRKRGQLVKYDDVLPHFGVVPSPTRVRLAVNSATFDFPDGSTATAPLLVDVVSGKPQRYAFVAVPRTALYNDGNCQPRNLKLSHLSAIYADLRRNPLHEAPGVRVGPTGGDGLAQLLMFDGQHKTVATWMLDRRAITCKVYFDLTAEQAIVLVNSVQAKIKKLPLSPFELAAKMSDEWENKLNEYEQAVGSEEASEDGFLAWLPQPDRARGKQAFRAALVDDILSDDGLQFRPFVPVTPGEKPQITETAFKTKVLDKLLHLNTLTDKGDTGARMRAQERANVLRLLNLFAQHALQYEGPEPPPHYELRVRRLTYQASLAYVFGLLRQVVGHKLRLRPPFELLKAEPTDAQWAEIEDSIRRIVDHPIWTADLSTSQKLKAVNDAMTKNQNIVGAFEAVHLDGAYADHLREWDPSDHED